MNRKDAARAKLMMHGVDLDGLRLRIEWGKYIEVTGQPIYDPSIERQIRRGEIVVTKPMSQELCERIDKLALFVSKEGYQFERIVKEREQGNMRFDFLFDHKSQDHYYYLWRVYSLVQVYRSMKNY